MKTRKLAKTRELAILGIAMQCEKIGGKINIKEGKQ